MKRYLKTPEEVIGALQTGKTLYDDVAKGSQWSLYKGVLIRKDNDGYFLVNTPICKGWNVYIEEPEPLKLEVGKFYKTRDGRKAWVVERIDTEDIFTFRVATRKEGAIYTVTKEGNRFSEGRSATDLVAPWEE